MGAKPSTANSGGAGHQSPRARTFSTSSSSDVLATGTGFNLLRAIPGMHVGGGEGGGIGCGLGINGGGGGGGIGGSGVGGLMSSAYVGSVGTTNDRQRARSLSAVPDLHGATATTTTTNQHHHHHHHHHLHHHHDHDYV